MSSAALVQWFWFTDPSSLNAAPTDLIAERAGANIHLTWTDIAVGNTGYDLQRATGQGAFASIETLGDVAEATDAGPFTLGQLYRYRVVVIGGAFDGAESNIVGTTPRPMDSVRRRLARMGRR